MCPGTVSEHTESQAEVELFGVIQRELSDNWVALHSLGLAIHARKPWAEADFVLVGPTGVFVLEVKGGRIRRRDGQWIFTTRHGRDSEPKSEGPFDQAGGAAAALRHYLVDRIPALRGVVVGYGVATPDMTFSVTGPDIIPDLVYDAADVGTSFEHYVTRLSEYWRRRIAELKGSQPNGLDDRMRHQVLELLRGDFDGRLSLRSRTQLVGKEIIRLTNEQFRVLDGLAENPRAIISGSAGTGKTLLAVEEALRSARRGDRVLLLCFNRALAANLRAAAAHPLVTVTSLHAYLADVVRRSGLEGEIPSVADSERLELFFPDVAFRAIVDDLVPDEFDVAIVDEAQDILLPRYLDVLDAVIVGGLSNGSWRIFYDPRQDLFQGLAPLGLKRLRTHAATYSLTVNCRNTRPIAVATGLLCGFMPIETLAIEGDAVETRWYREREDELRMLARDINRVLSAGMKPGDVMILGRRRLENSVLSRGLAGVAYPVADFAVPRAEARIAYATVQSFKGLEADIVFIVDVDDLVAADAVAELYVGASRARTALFVYLAESCREDYDARAAELGLRIAESE
jgi:hypothetical protein